MFCRSVQKVELARLISWVGEFFFFKVEHDILGLGIFRFDFERNDWDELSWQCKK